MSLGRVSEYPTGSGLGETPKFTILAFFVFMYFTKY